MRINFREAKQIITKSNIPNIDYVINPYIGCQHSCIYCYAEFMIRFTGHKGDKWGSFLDVKTFNLNNLKPHKYNGKSILISSVTDPYIPLELKFKNTRKILEKLINTKAKITILTKSKFVERDIDLLKKYNNIEVGISISTLDDKFAKIIEPGASKPNDRLEVIKTLFENQIKTYIFISPFFPLITDFRKIIEKTINNTNYYMFENLNFRPHNIPRIYGLISEHYPDILPVYKDFKKNPSRWDLIKDEIKSYCEKMRLQYHIEFHHGGFSKS